MKSNTIHETPHQVGQQLRGTIAGYFHALQPPLISIEVPGLAARVTALETDLISGPADVVVGAQVTFTLSTFPASGAWRATDVRVEPVAREVDRV